LPPSRGLGDQLGNKSIKPLGSKNCDWLDFDYSNLDCYYNLFEVGSTFVKPCAQNAMIGLQTIFHEFFSIFFINIF
jgi:hypothetical protein